MQLIHYVTNKAIEATIYNVRQTGFGHWFVTVKLPKGVRIGATVTDASAYDNYRNLSDESGRRELGESELIEAVLRGIGLAYWQVASLRG